MKTLIICLLIFAPTFLMSQQTYVPDDNFEQSLIDLGYDSGELDDSVATKNIENVKALEISGRSITDLTGIQDFTSLEELYCHKNSLTNLDVSQNTNLNTLYCYTNQLAEIDVSNLTLLQYLLCGANELSEIKFSDNHPHFISLNCHTNNITSLDLTNLSGLLWLICYDNKIGSLDVSNSTSLRLLVCYDNYLTELNIKNGNNANMKRMGSLMGMDARDNPELACIQVDDKAASENNYDWTKDPDSEYSADCGYTDVEEVFAVDPEISIFPNPADKIFTISFELEIPKTLTMTLTDLSGNELQEFSLINIKSVNKKIDVSRLSPGVYFLNISFGNESISRKIVVE
ncbi:MAG: T9SS type A sorting domain-containing protein [Chlorobi bacterium]|nr:T9SS type A sorting domain-containing protein [Chlorobiota bacterium]